MVKFHVLCFGVVYPERSEGRVGEVVTQESAKLPCAGSIPARASNLI